MAAYVKTVKAQKVLCEMCNRFYPDTPCVRKDCDWRQRLREEAGKDTQPYSAWTLATAQLPEEGEHVLCWYEYISGKTGKPVRSYGIGYQYYGRWGGEVAQGRAAHVIAWQLLPKPPEVDE